MKLKFCVLAAAAAVVFCDCRPPLFIRGFGISGFMLSDSYKREGFYPSVRDTQNLGVIKVLVRAESCGFNCCCGVIPVKVAAAAPSYDSALKAVDTVYGDFFYPDALDWYTKKPLRFFREAFRKADSLGMVFIPCVMGVADGGGAVWGTLHPALDSVRRAPDIVLNSYRNPDVFGGKTSCSTPFADDGPNGFDVHFREYLQRIRQEYDEFVALDRPKVHPPSLPAVSLSYDENYAVAGTPDGRSMLPLMDSTGRPCHYDAPYETSPYIHKVLLLGQDNPRDRAFCDSIAARNHGDYADAVRRLYAHSLWKRAVQVGEVFGPSTVIFVSGMMFDPQFGGATPWQTYRKSASGTGHNEYDHVVLSPAAGEGVLDLPGLDKKKKALVRSRVILGPWYFSTDRFDGTDPPPSSTGGAPFGRFYDHAATYRYFKNKGFRFLPCSILEIPAGDSCFSVSSWTALRNTVLALQSPEFKGYACGITAAFFPCHAESPSVCPQHEDTCRTCCRCGRLFENGYWYDALGMYDRAQPKEYAVLEYLAHFIDRASSPFAIVKTEASSRPHGRSVVRDTAFSIEGALAKAMPGDTVAYFRGTGSCGGVKAQRDTAAGRGIIVQTEGE